MFLYFVLFFFSFFFFFVFFVVFFFFFQAEDGIRDRDVTGVQTCALPISPWHDLPDRQLWREHRIRMIAPNRPNRLNLTQDRRELRRYCRRWKIERLFAWLHNFRRLVTRWEFYEANFLGMLQLGCLIILLRNL